MKILSKTRNFSEKTPIRIVNTTNEYHHQALMKRTWIHPYDHPGG
jgi:hypothetical protein